MKDFVNRVGAATRHGMSIKNVILNAGVLKYPNRATEMYDYSQTSLRQSTDARNIVPFQTLPFICTLIPSDPFSAHRN